MCPLVLTACVVFLSSLAVDEQAKETIAPSGVRRSAVWMLSVGESSWVRYVWSVERFSIVGRVVSQHGRMLDI